MSAFPEGWRLLLAHKQKTSARLRFLRLPHGLCVFDPLPALSTLLEDPPEIRVEPHPSLYLRAAEGRLGLPSGSLTLEPEFRAAVDAPGGPIRVRLATFTDTDPPFAAVEALGGRFIAITEARDCAPAELELLRLAYSTLIG